MESGPETDHVTPEPPLLSVPRRDPDTPPLLEQKQDPPRPWGFWLTIAFGLCICGAYVVPQVMTMIVVALLDGSIANPQAMEGLVAQVFGEIAGARAQPFEVIMPSYCRALLGTP